MRQYNHRVGYNIMARVVQGQSTLSWQGDNDSYTTESFTLHNDTTNLFNGR